MQASDDYEKTADELTNRILALIPDHQEILNLETPFDLFKIKEFNCKDLQPSLAQAQRSIGKAIAIYINKF